MNRVAMVRIRIHGKLRIDPEDQILPELSDGRTLRPTPEIRVGGRFGGRSVLQKRRPLPETPGNGHGTEPVRGGLMALRSKSRAFGTDGNRHNAPLFGKTWGFVPRRGTKMTVSASCGCRTIGDSDARIRQGGNYLPIPPRRRMFGMSQGLQTLGTKRSVGASEGRMHRHVGQKAVRDVYGRNQRQL